MPTGHSAESHKEIRKSQKENKDEHHHPDEKIKQLNKFKISGDILEVFGGQGNLTKYYNQFGKVTSMTKGGTGNSFDYIYKLRGENKKYNWIDIDSYGYPSKFIPVIFEMMKDHSTLVFTFPIVGVNCLNGISEQHFISHWRSSRPSIGDVVGTITDTGLKSWILPTLTDVVKIKRIWRFIFSCQKVKATEFCNVKNR